MSKWELGNGACKQYSGQNGFLRIFFLKHTNLNLDKGGFKEKSLFFKEQMSC